MKWKVLSSRYFVKNPWFTVRGDTCELPNGLQIEDFFVVEAPDWCHVIALTPKNEVVLVKQYRHALAEVTLELPGGIVDEQGKRQVSALTAVKRELLEETGYGGGSYTHLGSLSPNPARYDNLMHSFLAQGVTLQAEQNLDMGEDIEVVLKPLDAFTELAAQGEIMNTMHVGTLFLALHHLGRIKR